MNKIKKVNRTGRFSLVLPVEVIKIIRREAENNGFTVALMVRRIIQEWVKTEFGKKII